MIILIDNYDSFTFNLVQYLGDLNVETEVYRNNKITVDEVLSLNPKGIVISPGPSHPDNAGICLDLVKIAHDNTIPLFGVCLGHQAIGQALGKNGGKVIRAPEPLHGKISDIYHKNIGIFSGLPSPFQATRYHSLIIEKDSLPECFEITAETKDDLIMGIQHKEKPIHGVQFHPESIATEHGHRILRNFVEIL